MDFMKYEIPFLVVFSTSFLCAAKLVSGDVSENFSDDFKRLFSQIYKSILKPLVNETTQS